MRPSMARRACGRCSIACRATCGRLRRPRAIATSEPDQDRQLMTVATHPPSQRRSSPSPAARRNKSAISAQGRQSSSRPMPTLGSRASSPSETAAVAASDENTEHSRPPTPRSPAVRDPQIPIARSKNSPQPPRGFLLGRLSSAGPDARPTVAKGRRPKPSYEGPQVNRQLLVSVNSGLSDRVNSLPTSYPVGSCDPEPRSQHPGRGVLCGGSNLHIGALTGPRVSAATANHRPHLAREDESWSYAAFIFAPSGMTPSFT